MSSSSGAAVTPEGSLISDVQVFADVESGDVDGDDFRQIFRQTSDRERAHVLLEQATKGLNTDGFSLGFEDDFGLDLLGHGDRVKIHVNDVAADRMVLDFLDEGETAGGTAIGDLEINENVHRRRARAGFRCP